jgi:hypothetical protein
VPAVADGLVAVGMDAVDIASILGHSLGIGPTGSRGRVVTPRGRPSEAISNLMEMVRLGSIVRRRVAPALRRNRIGEVVLVVLEGTQEIPLPEFPQVEGYVAWWAMVDALRTAHGQSTMPA